MHFHPDTLRQINADRQQSMLAAAAAERLADSPGTRTRLAQFLRRTADRIDAATAPCGPQLGQPARRARLAPHTSPRKDDPAMNGTTSPARKRTFTCARSAAQTRSRWTSGSPPRCRSMPTAVTATTLRTYVGGSGDDQIQIVSNGAEASTLAPASARLDTAAIEQLDALGPDGADTITAVGNLAALTAHHHGRRRRVRHATRRQRRRPSSSAATATTRSTATRAPTRPSSAAATIASSGIPATATTPSKARPGRTPSTSSAAHTH